MRALKDYLLLFAKGLAMGGADVVPGVSGGTIAFISGIYEELIDSIKAVNISSIKVLLKGEFKEFWQQINGNFLIVLFAGIAISLASLAKLMTYLMVHNPIQLWSFFLGLILISSIVILRQIKQWSVGVVIAGIIGIVVSYFLTSVSPAQTSDSYLMIFLSGAIAICAMILPGISGAFILLILGKYQLVVGALGNLDFGIIFVFMAGALLGILMFVRVISWLLHKYHNYAIAVLAGFMMGSLNKIWPWKQVLEFRLNRHGEQVPFIEKNITPNQFLEATGDSPLIMQAILFMAIGFFIVVVVEKIALSLKK
ncbi:Integral membrane protein [hydrothermal vent metagenome]|uniref:Integral membrane protein n=1 Tax=hydrothermal vent metagenome TaxID=652676 RepID=A0A3B0UPA6_9ZZZZ